MGHNQAIETGLGYLRAKKGLKELEHMKNIMQPGFKGLSSHNLTAEELAIVSK
jgi:hypothetical protein